LERGLAKERRDPARRAQQVRRPTQVTTKGLHKSTKRAPMFGDPRQEKHAPTLEAKIGVPNMKKEGTKG